MFFNYIKALTYIQEIEKLLMRITHTIHQNKFLKSF